MNELTDEQKSAELARLCGWEYRHGAISGGWYLGEERVTPEFQDIDLYDPANMALAWRVLNWAHETGLCRQYADGVGKILEFWNTPAEAQRAWLDKVLQLATEAGMVENAS